MNPARWFQKFRQITAGHRYPFLGLFLMAVGGIVLGSLAGVPWEFWAATAAGLLIATLVFARAGTWILSAGVFCAFAFLQSAGVRFAPGGQLLELLGPGPAVWRVEGRVGLPAGSSPDHFVLFLDSVRAVPDVESSPAEEKGEPIALRGKIAVRWQGSAPDYGDRVALTGTLQKIPPPRNPGEMNYARWQQERGILLEMRSARESDQEILSGSAGFSMLGLAQRTRRHLESVLSQGISDHPDAVALLRAMTLGDTSGLPARQLETFRQTGTLHLFSVSGLHVGMLAVLLWMAFRLLPVPRPAAVVCVILLLFFYSAVTGLRPASLRAATMAAVVLAGFLLNRPARPLNSLAAAGFGILLFQPAQIFNPGFQLSFLVVTSILILGLPVQRWLRDSCGPDPFLPRPLYTVWDRLHAWLTREFGGLAAVSISAWIGSMPLILAYYHLVSLSAIPVNLLAVPLAFLILATGMLSIVSSLVWVGFASIFNHANLLLIGGLSGFVSMAADWPGSYFRIRIPEAFPPPARLVVFDAGRGAAQAWRAGRFRALIDTGPVSFWERTMEPWLNSEGVVDLNALVLTHGDSQHVGAARSVIERANPDWTGIGPLKDRSRSMANLARWMAENKMPRRLLMSGDEVSFGANSKLRILYPPPGLQPDVADDKALVLLLESNGWRILFLSDAGWFTEDWLLENASDQIQADLVITGRHVSGYATGSDFLRRVAPRFVVTSAVDFPEKEQLPAAWVDSLERLGIRVFSLDQTGAMTLDIHPGYLLLDGFLWKSPPVRVDRLSNAEKSGLLEE